MRDNRVSEAGGQRALDMLGGWKGETRQRWGLQTAGWKCHLYCRFGWVLNGERRLDGRRLLFWSPQQRQVPVTCGGGT